LFPPKKGGERGFGPWGRIFPQNPSSRTKTRKTFNQRGPGPLCPPKVAPPPPSGKKRKKKSGGPGQKAKCSIENRKWKRQSMKEKPNKVGLGYWEKKKVPHKIVFRRVFFGLPGKKTQGGGEGETVCVPTPPKKNRNIAKGGVSPPNPPRMKKNVENTGGRTKKQSPFLRGGGENPPKGRSPPKQQKKNGGKIKKKGGWGKNKKPKPPKNGFPPGPRVTKGQKGVVGLGKKTVF